MKDFSQIVSDWYVSSSNTFINYIHKCIPLFMMLFCINAMASNSQWNKQEIGGKMMLAGQYMQENNLVAADSIFSSIDDDDVKNLGTLEMDYFYSKGLVKYHLKDYKNPIPYFLKAIELHDSLGVIDNNYLIRLYILSHCYYMNGEYSNAENRLRWAIVKHKSLIENSPDLAAYYYLLLADSYEAMGDTLTSESIHFDKIQFFYIQKYLQNHPNDSLGQKVLDSYNQSKIIYRDYYSYTRTIDDLYIGTEWLDGTNMIKIGEPIEAVWCFENCIRKANQYIGKYSKVQEEIYMDLLKTYAKNRWHKDFDMFVPIAIDYFKNIQDENLSVFHLGIIFGNIFKEQGDFNEAYKCYMICSSYLNSGDKIENQRDQEIQLYTSLVSTCIQIKQYHDALSYCDSIETKLINTDKDYNSNLFWEKWYRCMALVNLEDYSEADECLETLKKYTLMTFGINDFHYITLCQLQGTSFCYQYRYKEAIDIYRHILELSEKNPDLLAGAERNVYYMLASAYFGISDYSSALKAFEKVAKIEIDLDGEVSDSTMELINECKIKL